MAVVGENVGVSRWFCYSCRRSYSRVASFKVAPSLLEELDVLARRLGVSRSDLIRAALLRVLVEPPSREELSAASVVVSDRRW